MVIRGKPERRTTGSRDLWAPRLHLVLTSITVSHTIHCIRDESNQPSSTSPALLPLHPRYSMSWCFTSCTLQARNCRPTGCKKRPRSRQSGTHFSRLYRRLYSVVSVCLSSVTDKRCVLPKTVRRSKYEMAYG